MGMTDRQFDAHNKTLLRLYEQVREEQKEIAEGKSKTSKTLEKLIKDTEELLNRP